LLELCVEIQGLGFRVWGLGFRVLIVGAVSDCHRGGPILVRKGAVCVCVFVYVCVCVCLSVCLCVCVCTCIHTFIHI
jgi:hypothetical protein